MGITMAAFWEENLKSDEWWKSNVEKPREIILTLNKLLFILANIFFMQFENVNYNEIETVDVGC